MATRRLFRRRTTGLWIRENAYAGVVLLALAGGAVGWMSLSGEPRPQSGHAPADLVAGVMPALVAASEPLTAPAKEPAVAPDGTPRASTTDRTVPLRAAKTSLLSASTGPASIGPAPRAAGGRLEAGRGRLPRWGVNSKSHAVKPTSRRVHSASAAAFVGRHHARVRWLRVSAGHRTQASSRRARAKVDEDLLDRPYDEGPHNGKPLGEAAWPPVQDAESSSGEKIEPASSTAACTRVVHMFGGMRRIPSKC